MRVDSIDDGGGATDGDAGLAVDGGSAAPSVPVVRVACEAGQWCWEQPTRSGAQYTDVLAESPSSVWLAGVEPGALMYFDGAQWSTARLPTNVVLSRFTHATSGANYAWGSRIELDGRVTGALYRRSSSGWDAVSLPANEAPIVVIDGPADRTLVAMDSSRVFALEGATWTALGVTLMSDERFRDGCRTPAGDYYFVSSIERRPAVTARWLWKYSAMGWQRVRSLQGNDERIAVGCTSTGRVFSESMAVPGMEVTAGSVAPADVDPPFAERAVIVGEWNLQLGVRSTSAGDTYVMRGSPHTWGNDQWSDVAPLAGGWSALQARENNRVWIDMDRERRIGVFVSESSRIGVWSVGEFRESVEPPAPGDFRVDIVPPPDGGPLRFGGRLFARDSSGHWSQLGGISPTSIAQSGPLTLWAVVSDQLYRLQIAADGMSVASQQVMASRVSMSAIPVFNRDDSGWLWEQFSTTVQWWNGSSLTSVNVPISVLDATDDRRGGLWLIDSLGSLIHCASGVCASSGSVSVAPRSIVHLQSASDQTLWIASGNLGTQRERAELVAPAWLTVVAPGGASTTLMPGANFVASSLFVANDGTAYVQSDRGILRFRNAASSPERIDGPALASHIYASTAGDLWIRAAKSGVLAHRAP